MIRCNGIVRPNEVNGKFTLFLSGNTADTKPTGSFEGYEISGGSMFLETDSEQRAFIYKELSGGDSWVEMS